MIYSPENCSPSVSVYDVDRNEIINHVAFIDMDRLEVNCADYPLQRYGDVLAMAATRYRSIHPIFGGKTRPILFHCYGREVTA
jgi:hypothetical protein